MRLPLLMVLLSYLVLVGTDLLILHDIRKSWWPEKRNSDRKEANRKKAGNSERKEARERFRNWAFWGFATVAVLVLALLTVAICLPKRDVTSDITPLMWMLYTVMTFVIPQLIYCIISLIGYIPNLWRGRRWPIGLWVGLPIAAIVFILMWWGALVGRKNIQEVNVDFSSEALPESFEGYKIVQFSDIHLGTWGNDTAFVSRFVNRINAQKPDLILFTGDAVNRVSDEFKPFIPVLSRLKAKDGVYTVLGNHDYGDYITWSSEERKRANLDSLKSFQRRAGWKMLDNAHTFIRNQAGDSIALIGVGNWGEPPFSVYGDMAEAYPQENWNDGNFKILMSHNPEHWNREVKKSTNVDLTLSGHTHAMQMVFKLPGWRWSPAEWHYKYWGGLYDKEKEAGANGSLYVNIGAGEVGIPMRIGADPEITVFTLHKKR